MRSPPPGYQQVTWEQLNNADIEIHKLAAQQVGATGVRPNLLGAKPLDEIFTKLMDSSKVLFFLLPLPKSAGSSNDSPDGVSIEQSGQKSHKTHRQNSGPSDRANDWYGKSKGKSSKSKVKSKFSKGANGKGSKSVPAALRGGKLSTNSGQPVCYNYNLGGCSDARPGQSCWRGFHLCSAPKCKDRRNHGLQDHKEDVHE